MSQLGSGGIATSEQLEQLIQDTNPLIDDRRSRPRLSEIPIEVDQHFLSQAEHRTLGEPIRGYELTLKRYPDTMVWPKTPENRLIDGHDALIQIRFDGRFADPDRSSLRVLYGIANTALDGAEPNYVARRDLSNHYGFSFTTTRIQKNETGEPLTSEGHSYDSLLKAFHILEQKPDFSGVDFADALKVGRTGEGLTDEEVAAIEVDSTERDLVANMNRELGVTDVSLAEVTALRKMLQRLRELPADAPEFFDYQL
jgi:hypothetical protein